MTARPDSVSVLGAGSWGTALALALARNLPAVRLWGRNAPEMAELARRRVNRRYLPGVPFPPNLHLEPDFRALIDRDLCFVVAVPSHAFRDSIQSLRRHIDAAGYSAGDATVIWGSKGFDPGSGQLLSEVVDETFGAVAAAGDAERGARAVISGPCVALETANLRPTALTLAGPRRGAGFTAAGSESGAWGRLRLILRLRYRARVRGGGAELRHTRRMRALRQTGLNTVSRMMPASNSTGASFIQR